MSSVSIPLQGKQEFQGGLKDGIGIALGYMPIALAFGLLAKSTGLSLYETAGMSAFVFAGASQFMTLQLLAAGSGLLEIVSTVFILNIRMLLMTTSLQEKLSSASFLTKAVTAFGVTDETFAVASTKGNQLSHRYIMGLNAMAYSSWVCFTAIGFLAVGLLPKTAQEAMGFALYAMFIALLVPCFKQGKKVFMLAGAAALLNTLFSLFLPAGISIFAATFLSAVGVEFIMRGART